MHIRNLKFYVDLGIKFTKTHQILKHQLFLLNGEIYIDECITLREESTGEFAIATWILFVNACFGKSIGNIRKNRDFRIQSQ